MKLEDMTTEERVCTVLNKLNEIVNKPASTEIPPWLVEYRKAEHAAIEKWCNSVMAKKDL